jgi:hypothetical protein
MELGIGAEEVSGCSCSGARGCPSSPLVVPARDNRTSRTVSMLAQGALIRDAAGAQPQSTALKDASLRGVEQLMP